MYIADSAHERLVQNIFEIEKRIFLILCVAGTIVGLILVAVDLGMYYWDVSTKIEIGCVILFIGMYYTHFRFRNLRAHLYTLLAYILIALMIVVYLITGALGTIQAIVLFSFTILGQFLIKKSLRTSYYLLIVAVVTVLMFTDEFFPDLRGDVDKTYFKSFYMKRKITFYLLFVPISYVFYQIKGYLNYYRETLMESNSKLKVANKDLLSLSDELRQQAEELTVLNESIHNKNMELSHSHTLIEHQKADLEKMNSNLEDLVKKRTYELINQNQKLMKYAYYNAHVFRAPVCRVKGLIQLMNLDNISEDERNKCWKYLLETSEELLAVSEEVSKLLDKNYKITYEEFKEIEVQVKQALDAA
ncbi:MAG: hypothetical protein NW207_03675 [Cytophagales bacterium]|nr:hypothetical protein [Cytophagales bacterium]